MNAFDLLQLLEQQKILSPRVIEKLRQQVRDSSRELTADALAQLLVQKGVLAQNKAQELLQQLKSAPPAATSPAADDDDELGLAPDDDLPRFVPTTPARKPQKPPPEPEMNLVPVDQPPGRPPATRRPAASAPQPPPSPPASGKKRRKHRAASTPEDAADTAEPAAADAELMHEALSEGVADEASGTAVRTRRRGLAGWFDNLRGESSGSKPRRKYSANRWDSPLMLMGGGALLLMLITAVGLWFYLSRGTGDDAFNLAYEDYRGGSYGQASAKFEQFLSEYPDHPKASQARVRIGLCRIWTAVTRKRWDEALAAVQAELPKIESQSDFNDARPELASLLPEIADGFAEQALKAPDIPAAQKYLGLSEQAFQAVNNSAYLPTSVRREQQPRVEQILAKLESVKRRINRDQQLEKTVAEIQTATQQGQIAQAYELQRQLLREYPGLETDPRLQAAVLTITQRERAAVQPLAQPPTPVTDERPSTAQFRVALAQRRGPATAESTQGTVCVVARGAAYGLQSASGQLLWRRFLGFESTVPPVPIGPDPNAAVLLIDARHHELLCVERTSGKLLWRLACGGPPAPPVVVGGRVYVATGDVQQGRLLAINPQSGAVEAAVTFPEALLTGPAVDVEQNRVVQPGAHSSLYLLNRDDLGCQQVAYLGHAAGTVVVPPVLLLGQILVVENPGNDFALLHVLGPNPEEPAEFRPRMDPLRLDGRVVVPLIAFSPRLLAATDRGQVHVFEIDPNNAAQPVRSTANAVSTVERGVLSYPLLTQSRLWISDSQLTQYELQISRGQLVRKWINSKGDLFLGPLQQQGSVLFSVRQRAGRQGATVAAMRIDSSAGGARDGEVIWETDLGVPPAGPPTVNRAAQQVQVVSSNAALFAIDTQAVRAGVLDQPQYQLVDLQVPALRRAVVLAEPRRAYTGWPPTAQAVVLEPENTTQPLRLLALAMQDDTPAADPAAFQNGLLLPTRGGRVQLLDLQTGRPLAHAFQPPLPAGADVKWQSPAVTADGKQAVLIDGSGILFRLQLKSDPQPNLAAALQVQTTAVPLAAPVIMGATVYVAARGADNDLLMAFGLDDFQAGSQWELPGRLVWGPYRAGEVVLVATDSDQLWAVDTQPEPRWKVNLPNGRLTGEPWLSDQELVLASVRGTVWQINAQTGAELSRVELDEPIGTGPVQFASNRMLVCGDDGTVHVINLPSP